MDRLSAILRTTADELWLSQGPENLMRNVPELWEAGLRTLTRAGMVSRTDARNYWTNQQIDRALA